jgi:uncharacterized pyridoxamine 5'-phosphate oxidase family protein
VGVIVTWEEVASRAPDLARFGMALFEEGKIAFLATVKADGGPRVHPVCPIFAGGSLFVVGPPTSPKYGDLRRDGRYALHALPDRRDNEFLLSGRALPVEEAETKKTVVAACPFPKENIRADDVFFELRIGRVLITEWDRPGQPGTRPRRRRWPAAR